MVRFLSNTAWSLVKKMSLELNPNPLMARVRYTANISNPSATPVQFIAAIFATFSCCNQMVAIGTTIWLQIKSAISSCKIYIYWLLQLIVAKFKENLI